MENTRKFPTTIASVTFIPSFPIIEVTIYDSSEEEDFDLEDLDYDDPTMEPSMNPTEETTVDVMDLVEEDSDDDDDPEDTSEGASEDIIDPKRRKYEFVSFDEWYRDDMDNICYAKKTVRYKRGTPVPKSKFKCIPKA